MIPFSSIRNKRIAYACLNWGLGHVTRSLDIVSELQANGNDVLVCGTERQIQLFKSYFPELKTYTINTEEFEFKGDHNFIFEGFRNYWRIKRVYSHVRKEVQKIDIFFQADFYISDHFYPFYHPKKQNIFVTHQYRLPEQTPCVISFIHRKWLKNFQAIWLVDDDLLRLAGSLSFKEKNTTYIGIRSRFNVIKSIEISSQSHDGKSMVCVLSGPETYARHFLNLLLQFNVSEVILISPFDLDESKEKMFKKVIRNTSEADQALLYADLIIARSGYSTLMDIVALKKKESILLPTKGQFEQEYLAKIHRDFLGISCDEHEFCSKLSTYLTKI